MLQIRKGVFETNSSSTHSLVICKENEELKLPGFVSFETNDYGWEFDTLSTTWEKASYLYSLAVCLDEGKTFIDKVWKWFCEDNIDCNFEIMYDIYDNWDGTGQIKFERASVDHAWDAKDFYKYVMHTKKNLYRFLFSDKSFIKTGNDNVSSREEFEDFLKNLNYRYEYFFKEN